jgi:DNA invertase Pin-like site-specific DNA recombinase
MLKTVDMIHRRGAALRVLTQQIDTTTASGRCFLHMLGVIAEFEREIGRERTKAGLDAARARGRRPGQPLKYSDEDVRRALALREQGQTWPQAAASIGISPQRLQSRAREMRRREEYD